MIPKPTIEWQEPPLFKSFQGKSATNSVRLSIRIFVLVAVMGGCCLAWYFGKENSPDKHASLPAMLTLGAVIGGFIAFVVPMLRGNAPYRVGFYEKGISRANRSDIRFWKYEIVASAALTLHQHQNQTLRVLTLNLKDGKEVAAGIADGVQTDAIVDLFTKQGIKCASDKG